MVWRTSIVAPSAVFCGRIALSAGLIGGCGGPNYVRGRDGGGTGGAGDGTGGAADASGGTPGSGSGGEPVATGGTGTAGSGGAGSPGGRSGTGGASAAGAMGSTGGAVATGTGGGIGGAAGGMIASGGGATATGGRGTGGAATGGNGSGGRGTGGANTGGANTGGANTGGANTGGANTGGANTGGANTGGANTGGANTGGAATGGMGTGGVSAPSGAILYYPFDETTGTAVADQSGNARNGAVNGGGTFGPGMIRNGLTFLGGTTTGTSTYVSIPVGLLTSTRDMTISLWVKVTATKNWQRILDLSKSTTTGYMFLTTHTATTPSVVRFGITATGNTAEQRIDVPLLPLDTWKHLALVFSATGASFFVDGVKAATNTALTLRPADLGVLTNQWLGRSVFTQDPYFAGQLDELRIYGRALSDAEVGVLYNLR